MRSSQHMRLNPYRQAICRPVSPFWTSNTKARAWSSSLQVPWISAEKSFLVTKVKHSRFFETPEESINQSSTDELLRLCVNPSVPPSHGRTGSHKSGRTRSDVAASVPYRTGTEVQISHRASPSAEAAIARFTGHVDAVMNIVANAVYGARSTWVQLRRICEFVQVESTVVHIFIHTCIVYTVYTTYLFREDCTHMILLSRVILFSWVHLTKSRPHAWHGISTPRDS